MNKQELNTKLAEWAGIEVFGIDCWYKGKYIGQTKGDKLEFTQSVDATFKWLVPEAMKKLDKNEVYLLLWSVIKEYVYEGGEVSELLCLAFEKLIDSGNRKGGK